MPLNRYKGRPEDEICAGCKLHPTKSEDAPAGAAEATELFTLQKAGARFDYPNGLLPYEWAAMIGLQQGSAAAETERRKKDKRKAS